MQKLQNTESNKTRTVFEVIKSTNKYCNMKMVLVYLMFKFDMIHIYFLIVNEFLLKSVDRSLLNRILMYYIDIK